MTPRAIRTMTAAIVLAVGLAGARPILAEDFEENLARVDAILRSDPPRAPFHALESCQARRNSAVKLYSRGQYARAQRRLEFCNKILHMPEVRVAAAPTGPTMEEIQAQAAQEVQRALTLTPDLDNGLEVYRSCAQCHMPEGWGMSSGVVPQLAGQHRKVVIKQLTDIRAGNRDAVLMLPYASAKSIGGTQAVADVAGYIDTLEISVENGKGPGKDLALGKQLYEENCVRCHGAAGAGENDGYVPRIQAQHFHYLVRQFEWIRDGKRRNANPEMVAQIRDFDDRETRAVLDYVSRLEPPAEFQAPPGWHNPDFAN